MARLPSVPFAMVVVAGSMRASTARTISLASPTTALFLELILFLTGERQISVTSFLLAVCSSKARVLTPQMSKSDSSAAARPRIKAMAKTLSRAFFKDYGAGQK